MGLQASTAEAQSVRGALRAYSARHCSVESLIERVGLYTTPMLDRATNWLDYTLSSDAVKILWRQSNAVDQKGEFTYIRNGHRFYVWWDNFLSPDAPVRRRLLIRACLFVPQKLEILDTDYEDHGTSARVIYMPDEGYSWIGEQFSRLGILKGNNSFPSMDGMAYVGELTEARNGDWHVDDVD